MTERIEPVVKVGKSSPGRLKYAAQGPWSETEETQVAAIQGDNRTARDVGDIISMLNRELQKRGTYLRFQLVRDTGELQVHVVDSQTGEIVRKMPPDYLYQVKETIRAGVGLIVNDEAG